MCMIPGGTQPKVPKMTAAQPQSELGTVLAQRQYQETQRMLQESQGRAGALSFQAPATTPPQQRNAERQRRARYDPATGVSYGS